MFHFLRNVTGTICHKKENFLSKSSSVSRRAGFQVDPNGVSMPFRHRSHLLHLLHARPSRRWIFITFQHHSSFVPRVGLRAFRPRSRLFHLPRVQEDCLVKPRKAAWPSHLRCALPWRGLMATSGIVPANGFAYPRVSKNPYPNPSQPLPLDTGAGSCG